MGLDITVYRYDNFKQAIINEESYEKEHDKIWNSLGKRYEELTEAERNIFRNQCQDVAARLGLDEWGLAMDKQKIERTSEKHPTHFFKIGYCRSSYNDSGLDRMLGNLIDVTLGSIFEYKEEQDRWLPEWGRVRQNAIDAIAKLDAEIKAHRGAFSVICVSYNEFEGDPNGYPVDSEEKALKEFLGEQEKETKRSPDTTEEHWYSGKVGDFFLGKPLELSAAIRGVRTRLLSSEKLPCTYLIFKNENIDWYRQALEIIVETCDYILAQPDSQKYYVHWSG